MSQSKVGLSLLIITKNEEKMVGDCLESVRGLVNEIILGDDFSTDNTVLIAKKYQAKVFIESTGTVAGQRKYGLSKVTNDWVLILDADERISAELKKEMIKWLTGSMIKNTAFLIPFQSFYLGRPLYYGGENYSKFALFKKSCVKIDLVNVHEHFVVKKGKTSKLRNKILHYSYRSISEMYKKFTDYAFKMAHEKYKMGERSSFKKIFLYPLHMIWARFIKDKGYKDGMFRLPLDIGFGYMEFVTYFVLFLKVWQYNLPYFRIL